MKAALIVLLAAIAAPSLSMKIGHSSKQQYSSISKSSGLPASANEPGHLSPRSGDTTSCAKVEAKQEYYLAQVKELKSQNIAIPAYLAGYATAAADSLDTLGCPANSKSKALDPASTE